jgi:pimeloyl-ACP methyl ester carboxylesterase
MTKTIVCLHGWGASKESFTELRAALGESDITILSPDLPGFGQEPEPSTPWNVDDFADWVTTFIRKNVSGPFHLLGHSNGGRISIKLAARKTLPIEHLYLCASAGIRHPRHIKRMIGLTLAKSGKTLLSIPGCRRLEPLGKKLLYKLVRVHDYEQASSVMRQTLIRVSAEDLRPLLKSIEVPTDIFWGKEDKMTPFSDALVMQKEIEGSVLHAFDGVRHRVHRDKAADIATVIRAKMQTA